MLQLFHSKNAQSLGTWLGILTSFFTLMGKLTPEWFGQLTWPQLILGAFGAALTTLLILALIAFLLGTAGALYRQFKLLSVSEKASASGTPAYEDSEVRRKVDSLAEIMANFARDRDELMSLEDKLTERAKALQDALLVHIAAEAKERGVSDAALSTRLDEHRSILIEHDSAFLAIYHRERMLSLAGVIDKKSLDLARPPSEGKVMNVEEWETWKSERAEWEDLVNEWGQWARDYFGRDPMGDLKRIKSEELDENWGATSHQFPDPEGLRIYKTFRIFVRNWVSVRDVVHQKVRRKAFEGVTL